MKLAEALSVRSDLQERLYQLEVRLNNNSKVQEGDEPNEDPSALLAELDTIPSQLEDVISRINRTNGATVSPDGKTLAELVAHRDVMKRKASMLRSFLDSASETVGRHSASEIRIVSTVDVKKLRKEADALAEDVRKTDMAIQELNWTTELI